MYITLLLLLLIIIIIIIIIIIKTPSQNLVEVMSLSYNMWIIITPS